MIDFLLANYGDVGAIELMDWFGISSACATRDFQLYKELCPDNTSFSERNKRWHRTTAFVRKYP